MFKLYTMIQDSYSLWVFWQALCIKFQSAFASSRTEWYLITLSISDHNSFYFNLMMFTIFCFDTYVFSMMKAFGGTWNKLNRGKKRQLN